MTLLQYVLVGLAVVYAVLHFRSPQRALSYLRWVVLFAAAALVLAPFMWLLAAPFKDKSIFNEYVFLPPPSEWSRSTLNLANFVRLFEPEATLQGTVRFGQYVLNSIFFATTGTALQLVFCSAAGFALAKYEFRGKRALLIFMLGSMMVPAVLLFAPLYEIMVDLGLIDTYHGLILPGVVSAYGIFLFRQAMLGIPDEMLDAGRIDGASELRIYMILTMPLVRPMSAAFCLITFLGNWNSFFGPSVFLQSQEKFTLPLILNRYVDVYSNEYGVFLAGTLLAIIPPALLFILLEREFVSGLTSGAVKG